MSPDSFQNPRRLVTVLPIFKITHVLYIVRKITPAVEKLPKQTHTCCKTRDNLTRHTCCLHGSQIATERQLPCKPESGHVVLVHIVHFDLCERSTPGSKGGLGTVHLTQKAFINELEQKKKFALKSVVKLEIMSPAVFKTMHVFSSGRKGIVSRAYGSFSFLG